MSLSSHKTYAYSVAVANAAYAVSGVLINTGILLVSISILVALMYSTATAGLFSLSAANAATVCVAVALLSACVVFCSARDLVKSCKQLKQAREEGLPTVQPLQPVLAPATSCSEAVANTRRHKQMDVIAEVANSFAALAMLATFTALAIAVIVAIESIFISSAIFLYGAFALNISAFNSAKVAVVAAAAAVVAAVLTALFAAIATRAAKRCTVAAVSPVEKTATNQALMQIKNANLATKISGISAIVATTTAAVAALIVPFSAKASNELAIVWGVTTASRTAAATAHTTGIMSTAVGTVAYLPHALIALSVACSLCLLIHIAVDIYLARIPYSQRNEQHTPHRVADQTRNTFSKSNSLQPKGTLTSMRGCLTRGHSDSERDNPAYRGIASRPLTPPAAADPKHRTLTAAVSVVMICGSAFLLQNYTIMSAALPPAAALLLYCIIAWVRKSTCSGAQALDSNICNPTLHSIGGTWHCVVD
ncbi:hypothetical protein AOV_03840 [Anaplasma ovis str. Haibei]|uniref:Uncharacterized protein n=1 Tax=Anaplasma ovis str. Haibei TaxID=1248439 RepID=A0A2Z2L8M5_9RICK|nr:hypothetical protein [Anaplasma ovis]ASI47918.1 hypothetical protein AOV_03840 [Anaplasma ovis str. Haibei]